MTIKLDMPDTLMRVLKIFEENNTPACCVGGCVRDTILGITPHDWDIATYLKPDQVKELLSRYEDLRFLEVGKAFGVIKVFVNGDSYEIATYRKEARYFDGRRPSDVEFVGDLKTDLARRDFTCNAMAVDMYGNLYDYYGGYEDISKGVLRAVGEPEARFEEDALRIMRALRFSTRFGFKIEPETSIAIRKSAYKLTRISKERINEELRGILNCAGAYKIFNAYREVFAVIIPELSLMFDFSQNNKYHIYDVWHHALASMRVAEENYGNDIIMKLVALFHDIGKPAVCTEDEMGIRHFYTHAVVSADLAYGIMKRLRFTNEEVNRVTDIIRYHDITLTATRPAVRRAMYKFGVDVFEDICRFRLCDLRAYNPQFIESRVVTLGEVNVLRQQLKEEGTALKVTDLAVTGYDLMDLGLKGKEIGIVQRRLLDAVINGDVDGITNNKDELIQLARTYMKSEEYKKSIDNFINQRIGY